MIIRAPIIVKNNAFLNLIQKYTIKVTRNNNKYASMIIDAILFSEKNSRMLSINTAYITDITPIKIQNTTRYIIH